MGVGKKKESGVGGGCPCASVSPVIRGGPTCADGALPGRGRPWPQLGLHSRCLSVSLLIPCFFPRKFQPIPQPLAAQVSLCPKSQSLNFFPSFFIFIFFFPEPTQKLSPGGGSVTRRTWQSKIHLNPHKIHPSPNQTPPRAQRGLPNPLIPVPFLTVPTGKIQVSLPPLCGSVPGADTHFSHPILPGKVE